MLNYKKLSISLGIHKDSYNYLNKVQSINRMKNINKLRKLYNSSIDRTPNAKKTSCLDYYATEDLNQTITY
jgi:hypothetical protein